MFLKSVLFRIATSPCFLSKGLVASVTVHISEFFSCYFESIELI